MTEVYVGQIMLTGFGFAPRGYANCNGRIMAISQNQALFSLLGTTYGGDGRTTFGLPNMQSRTPVGFGPSADPAWQPSPPAWGEVAGVESVTVTTPQLPTHAHICAGTSSNGSARNPSNALYGTNATAIYASAGSGEVTLAPQTIASAGGGQPHANLQPYLAINFNIALMGVFPSRN